MAQTHPVTPANTLNPWEPDDKALMNNQPVKVLSIDGTRCTVILVDETDAPLPDTEPETVNMNALSPRKQWPDRPDYTPPILYPVDSTAFAKSLVTRVTIKGVKHDTRQVEWHRGEDPRPFKNTLNINELSDSDDPYTRATLGQVVTPPTAQGADDSIVTPFEAWVLATHAPVPDTDTESALAGWTRAKMAVTGQTPIHPADPLTLDQAGESTIAQAEIDAAQMANKLGEKIAERDATINAQADEITDLKNRLRMQTNETVRALNQRDEAERERAKSDELLQEIGNDLDASAERIDELEKLVVSKDEALAAAGRTIAELMTPQKQPIETMILKNPDMEQLAFFINEEGWRVVFETVYVMGGYQEAYNTHFLRLEREIITPATPPHAEARAAVVAPIPDAAPTEAMAEDATVILSDQPAVVFHVTPMTTPMYEPINPADIDPNAPLEQNLMKYGPEAVSASQNMVLRNVMGAALLKYQAETGRLISQPTRFHSTQA